MKSVTYSSIGKARALSHKQLGIFCIFLFFTNPALASKIEFLFTHQYAPTSVPSPYNIAAKIVAHKGPHIASSCTYGSESDRLNCWLNPGQTKMDYTSSNIFANDPKGVYEVLLECRAYEQSSYKIISSFSVSKTALLEVEKDDVRVQIDITCPIKQEILNEHQSRFYFDEPTIRYTIP